VSHRGTWEEYEDEELWEDTGRWRGLASKEEKEEEEEDGLKESGHHYFLPALLIMTRKKVAEIL
jgi:hypothetical protein